MFAIEAQSQFWMVPIESLHHAWQRILHSSPMWVRGYCFTAILLRNSPLKVDLMKCLRSSLPELCPFTAFLTSLETVIVKEINFCVEWCKYASGSWAASLQREEGRWSAYHVSLRSEPAFTKIKCPRRIFIAILTKLKKASIGFLQSKTMDVSMSLVLR